VPTTTQHLAQAATNETLALAWEVTAPEWAATALFYAALHYVDAFFYLDGQINHSLDGFKSHEVRTREVSLRLGFVYQEYQRLLDRSRNARYDCIAFDTRKVQNLRAHNLLPIRQYVESQLKTLGWSP